MNFSTWSREWKSARKNINIARVLELWATPLPENWKRYDWKGALGFRKNHANDGEDRGEQKLERLFLNYGKIKQLDCCSVDSSCPLPLTSLYHNLPLTKQLRGQIIADAFAAITVKRQTHPLLVEIKFDQNNCWYALVENLLQVRMARACESELLRRFEEAVGTKCKGAWGMVLAPNKYYENRRTKEGLEEGIRLLNELKMKTEARVAFCGSKEINNGKIEIIASNWEM